MKQLTLVEIEVVCRRMLVAAGTGCHQDLLTVEGSFYYFLAVNSFADLDTFQEWMDTRTFLPFRIIKSKYVSVGSLWQYIQWKNIFLSNIQIPTVNLSYLMSGI